MSKNLRIRFVIFNKTALTTIVIIGIYTVLFKGKLSSESNLITLLWFSDKRVIACLSHTIWPVFFLFLIFCIYFIHPPKGS